MQVPARGQAQTPACAIRFQWRSHARQVGVESTEGVGHVPSAGVRGRSRGVVFPAEAVLPTPQIRAASRRLEVGAAAAVAPIKIMSMRMRSQATRAREFEERSALKPQPSGNPISAHRNHGMSKNPGFPPSAYQVEYRPPEGLALHRRRSHTRRISTSSWGFYRFSIIIAQLAI